MPWGGFERVFSMSRGVGFAHLLIVVCILLLGGVACRRSQEIHGQVFLVQNGPKGPENWKLALVELHLLSESELKKLAAEVITRQLQANADLAARKAKVEEQQRLLLRMEEDLSKVPAQVLALSEYQALLQSASTLRAELGLRYQSYAVSNSVNILDRLFDRLPAARAKTDADGEFRIHAGKGQWLLAQAERKGADGAQTFVWVVPIPMGEAKLLLANDNQVRGVQGLWELLGSVSGVSIQPLPLPSSSAEDMAAWMAETRQKAQLLMSQELVRAQARKKQGLERASQSSARISTGSLSPGEQLMLRTTEETFPVRWIPPGRFTMGSPADEVGVEKDEPQHEVTLTQGFFIMETECPQRLWNAFMTNNPSRFQGEDLPVEQINWHEAREFCLKLTELQRSQGWIPPGWKWELPTEAQWEYAARAGNSGSPAGSLEESAWYQKNSDGTTHPVGQRKPNAWGLLDVLGNVWEWCLDGYGDYPTVPVTDPQGTPSSPLKVFRGSGCNSTAQACRFGFRNAERAVVRNGPLGIRGVLVRSSTP